MTPSTVQIGDLVTLHGIITQYTNGDPNTAELGYAYGRQLRVISLFKKREHLWIEAGPDEYGNTYIASERQAKIIQYRSSMIVES